MKNIDALTVLDDHITMLHEIYGKQIFLVGGCVRDILFGITKEPLDIDVTGFFSYEEIRAKTQEVAALRFEGGKDDLSMVQKMVKGVFTTEKFGTTTLIIDRHAQHNKELPKGDTSRVGENIDRDPLGDKAPRYESESDENDDSISGEEMSTQPQNTLFVGGDYKGDSEAKGYTTYEITPFREEGGYDDYRHPRSVTRSASLLADAQRRDFTVNTLYYTSFGCEGRLGEDGTKSELIVNTADVLSYLHKQGRVYIPGGKLLIVQDTGMIEKMFVQGELEKESLQAVFAANGQEHIDISHIRILLDPMCGLQDSISQKLKTVGNPDKRFQEDALRILRALRFVNIWNQKIPNARFDFTKETWNSIKENAPLLRHIARERIHQELVKVFIADNPFGYVALLDEANLLDQIFPALSACKHNDQPVRYHPFDTYAHTMLTLWHLQQINTDYLVKLAMLYHDVGKPGQYEYYQSCTTPEEIASVHASPANHITSGPLLAKADLEALAFSNKEIDTIMRYVAQHMRPGQILDASADNQIKKVRLLYSEAGYEKTKNLFDICKADRLGQYNPLQSNEITAVDVLYEYLERLRGTEGQFTMSELAINGTDIMQELHMRPGPDIGMLLKKAFDWVVHEKDARNTKQAILKYIKGLPANERKDKATS